MIAVIGGSGLTRIPELEITQRQIVRTPYGLPSSPLWMGRLGAQEIVFLARHGLTYSLAPHEINYRANIWALNSLTVSGIIAVSAVTTLSPDYQPGTLVLPDDLIDYTHGRTATFFEQDEQPAVHTDFTEPYDAELRQTLIARAKAHDAALKTEGVYGCLQGPRTPTRAEMRRLRQDGVDFYGMTGMPEAFLAREIGLPYVHLCGIIGSGDNGAATAQSRNDQTREAIENIRRLLQGL